jgi:hypothetical protein
VSQYGVMPEYGVKQYGASEDYGVRPDYGVGQGDSGPVPSALTSTLTSSASSFVAGSAGVTLTFTARDVASNPIEGYTPVPQSGVTP